MIICHCAVVSDRQITRAIDEGARTLAQLCRATGAGGGCGSCVLSIKRLLCQHQPSVSEIAAEVEYAAS